MSSADQRRLVKVAQGVIASVRDDGLHPTDALIKQASEANLNPEEMRRVAEAYNVSRTLSHLQEKSGQDRLEEFPVADADAAIAKAFPDKAIVKAAAEFVPMDFGGNSLIDELYGRETLADLMSEPTESPATPVVSPDRISRNMYKAASAARRDIAAAESRLSAAEVNVDLELIKASSAVRGSLREMKFETIEQAIKQHYPEADTLVELLWETSKAASLGASRAKEDWGVDVDLNSGPFPAVADFVKASSELAIAQSHLDSTLQKSQEALGAVKQANAATVSNIKAASLTGGVLSSFFGGLGGLSSNPAYQKELGKAIGKVEDPDHRDEMTRIQTRSVLSDLLKNDPVISTYDPDEVMDHYNELAKLSPEVADQPMAVRGILRRSLQQGGVDPMEVGQYLAAGKTMIESGEKYRNNSQSLSNSIESQPGSSPYVAGSPVLGLAKNMVSPGKPNV
jgi:hypothetical protein